MRHEFALTVERSEGTWSVEITDEQGDGVRRKYGLSLQYAMLDAVSFVCSRAFEDVRDDEQLALRGGHP